MRRVVHPEEGSMIVSNIGVTPDFSAIYTPNSAQHTAFVQVSLEEGHRLGSYEYMNRVRAKLQRELPELSTYFQSGGLVDGVLNLGLPAPIDVQVSGLDMAKAYQVAVDVAGQVGKVPGVSDVLIPQDLDYPALRLDIDRERASLLGLSQREVVNNVITALSSNQMIAPSYWVDPKSGNDYFLTVQYRENAARSLAALRQIPIQSAGTASPTQLHTLTTITPFQVPPKITHYLLPHSVC